MKRMLLCNCGEGVTRRINGDTPVPPNTSASGQQYRRPLAPDQQPRGSRSRRHHRGHDHANRQVIRGSRGSFQNPPSSAAA